MGLIDILSCINHRFWLQNLPFWNSATDSILHTILYLVLVRDILKIKGHYAPPPNIRRGTTGTRRPTSEEHPEMLWKENPKARSEETCLGYKKLPFIWTSEEGKRLFGKQRIICFSYQEAAYEQSGYSYSHSDLFWKKLKTNCKGATKKKERKKKNW